jgi:hypothetical protein
MSQTGLTRISHQAAVESDNDSFDGAIHAHDEAVAASKKGPFTFVVAL